MSFKDTFTREDKKGNVLEYDDTAFLYFACSVAAVCLSVWSLWLIKRWWQYLFPSPPKVKWHRHVKWKVVDCKCSICASKKQPKVLPRLVLETVILGVLWCLIGVAVWLLGGVTPMATFDPFDILEVAPGSSDREIRKAYHLMSLRWHPDKNQGDPTAAAKFLMVTKAFQSLSNEEAKKNFEKFGNPDGPSALKIGIGLPRLLVEEGNQLPVLVLFFSVLLVFFPMLVLTYYNRQNRYAASGAYLDSLHLFGRYLDIRTPPKTVIELFCASSEFREVEFKQEDKDALTKFGLEDTGKPFFTDERTVLLTKLMQGHLRRKHNLMTPNLNAILRLMLQNAYCLTAGMAEVALRLGSHNVLKHVIDVRRGLIHGTDRAHCITQFPHVPHGAPVIPTPENTIMDQLKEFLHEPGVTKDQRRDIETVASIFPIAKVVVKASVEGETNIVEGDIMTFNIQITRLNLKTGELAGKIHTSYDLPDQFPSWLVLLVDQTGGIQGVAPYRHRMRNNWITIQCPAREAGKVKYEVRAYSDTHYGADLRALVELDVLSEKTAQRRIEIHQEDIDLDKQPTLFQQMVTKPVEEQSDEEDE